MRGVRNKVRLDRRELWAMLMRENMSQNEFAEIIGVSSGYMCQIMHGVRYPGPKVRDAIIEATGRRWDELFYELK